MNRPVRASAVILVVALAITAVGCRKRASAPASNAPAPVVAQPGSADGLQNVFDDILAALKAGNRDRANQLTRAMLLKNPDAWFRRTFGDEVGAKAAAEYIRMTPNLESQFVPTLEGCLKKNQTNVRVTRLDGPNDPNANGNQKRALELMKEKMPLYSVRLLAPGQSAGYHMYSFVHVDGEWRVLGKMMALK